MNFFWMLLAFLILTGAALLYCSLLKLNIGEGMLLGVSTATGLLYLSGTFAGTFTTAMYAIFGISAAGYLFFAGSCVGKRQKLLCIRSPYFAVILGLFAFAVLVYTDDFIQHIDEFHQWAAAVKYMLEADQMPGTSALLSANQPYGTSLFYLFFQKLTGYNEGNMYAAEFLLIWTGFLLPFSGYQKKDWKKIAMFAAILYPALYSLYLYGPKNLYVDLPTAAWAGGLAGWWMNRTKKKANGVVAAAGLFMICGFKALAGPLMAVITAEFMLVYTGVLEKGVLDSRQRRKKVMIGAATAFAILFAAGLGVFLWGMNTTVKQMLPDSWLAWFEMMQITDEKIRLTFGSLLAGMTGSEVASASRLKIAFLPFLIFMMVLTELFAKLYDQKKKQRMFTVYFLCNAGLYCIILFCAFIFVFTYEESISATGSGRYISIYMLYVFVILLTWFFQRKPTRYPGRKRYLAFGLLLLFLYGLNSSYIAESTGLNPKKVSKYSAITTVKNEINCMDVILTEEDRVYLLNQADTSEYSTSEYITNTAFYYLWDQVSNYLTEPWKFLETGCRIRVADYETPTLADFPRLLAEGGYTYVWIYQTNKYLTKNLPDILDCDEVKSACLYRVTYQDGWPVGLELAIDFEELGLVEQ